VTERDETPRKVTWLVPTWVADRVQAIAVERRRSTSAMATVLLVEALARRAVRVTDEA